MVWLGVNTNGILHDFYEAALHHKRQQSRTSKQRSERVITFPFLSSCHQRVAPKGWRAKPLNPAAPFAARQTPRAREVKERCATSALSEKEGLSGKIQLHHVAALSSGHGHRRLVFLIATAMMVCLHVVGSAWCVSCSIAHCVATASFQYRFWIFGAPLRLAGERYCGINHEYS